MNNDIPPLESSSPGSGFDRSRFGLGLSVVGLIFIILGAKPDWFNLDRNTGIVGFAQITVFLIGLAILCIGGYVGLSTLWNGDEKSIVADIGSRLISTGYVIALFCGFADVFGITFQRAEKKIFFGPWQEAGMQIGLLVILAGILMVIPYRHLGPKDKANSSSQQPL